MAKILSQPQPTHGSYERKATMGILRLDGSTDKKNYKAMKETKEQHNERVNKQRIEHHLRRCEESSEYKLIYENFKELTGNLPMLKYLADANMKLRGKILKWRDEMPKLSYQEIFSIKVKEVGVLNAYEIMKILQFSLDWRMVDDMIDEAPYFKEFSDIEEMYDKQKIY